MSETLFYPLFMVASMLLKGYGASVEMRCVVEHSDDGENHFTLLKQG